MQWLDLPPGLVDEGLHDRCDGYLRVAAGTGFADHFESLPSDAALHFSVQLADGRLWPETPGIVVPPAYVGSPFFTARVAPDAIDTLLGHPDVTRVQWAEGVLTQRPRRKPVMPWHSPAPVTSAPPSSRGSLLLLGVIDAGCPFAHADLRTPDLARTRIVRLWSQDPDPGVAPASMRYGSELTDADLNAIMAACSDASGRVDEQACYRMAGAEAVLGRLSHGAHGLGLLGASTRHDGRPVAGLARPLRECAGAAGRADIAFVQLPRKLLDAPFPAALEHHALDGLRYILEVGASRQCDRIVVSFAFESWLGPHDATTWFDLAVQHLIGEADRRQIKLEVFFVAGNSGQHDVHRRLGAGESEVQWMLQPDDQSLTHVEIWVPRDGAFDDLSLELRAPGHEPLPAVGWGAAVAWPQVQAPAVCAVMDRSGVLGTSGRVIVLRISPTRVFDRRQSAAPHGLWSLRLRSAQSLEGIDVYIGRGVENLGSPPRGRQATLARRSAEQIRADRRGTLNGHACHPGAVVTTACVAMSCADSGGQSPLEPGRAAPYAGSGPTRDGGREGPSFGVAVEYGSWHSGFIGIGNRSGVTFRLSGTSVSAPLGARLVIDEMVCDPKIPPDDYPAKAQEVGPCVRLPF